MSLGLSLGLSLGNQILGGLDVPSVAAAFDRLPSISPSLGFAGDTFAIDTGTATGAAPVVISFTLFEDGVDVTSNVANDAGVLSYVGTTDGALVLTVTASNGVGDPVVEVVNAAISLAPPQYVTFPGDTYLTGPADAGEFTTPTQSSDTAIGVTIKFRRKEGETGTLSGTLFSFLDSDNADDDEHFVVSAQSARYRSPAGNTPGSPLTALSDDGWHYVSALLWERSNGTQTNVRMVRDSDATIFAGDTSGTPVVANWDAKVAGARKYGAGVADSFSNCDIAWIALTRGDSRTAFHGLMVADGDPTNAAYQISGGNPVDKDTGRVVERVYVMNRDYEAGEFDAATTMGAGWSSVDDGAFSVEWTGQAGATLAANQVSANGVLYTFDESVTKQEFKDGGWEVVPSSGTSVDLTSISLAPTTIGSRNIHGITVDPSYLGNQSWDSLLGNYVAPPTLPLTLNTGEVFTQAISSSGIGANPSGTVKRGGVIDQYNVISVASSLTSGSNLFTPPAVSWAGRSAVTPVSLDLEAYAASLPSLDLPGFTFPSLGTMLTRFANLNLGYALDPRSNAGYEYHMNRNWGNVASGILPHNYAQYMVMEQFGETLMALLSNQFTASEKAQILLGPVSFGGQSVETMDGANASDNGGGGHAIIMEPFAALYLDIKGDSRLATLPEIDDIGIFTNAFRITQDMLDNQFTNHNDVSKPSFYRRRELISKSGTTMTLEGHSGDYSKMRTNGCVLTDGTLTANVTTTNGDLNGSNFTVGIDGDPGFTTGADLWFEAPAPLSVGDVWWNPRNNSDFSEFVPNTNTTYIDQQKWEGFVLFSLARDWHTQQASGTSRDRWDNVLDYFVAAQGSTLPTGPQNFPSMGNTRTLAANAAYSAWYGTDITR